MIDLTQLITLDELAEQTGMSRPTVYGWRRRYIDSFPRPKKVLGRQLLFDYAEVLTWVRERLDASVEAYPDTPQMQLGRGLIKV